MLHSLHHRNINCSGKRHLQLISIFYLVVAAAATSKTCGGTAGGAACKFPFEWKGVEYSECTRNHDVHNRLWCGTTAEGKWGYCKCSDEVVTTAATPKPTKSQLMSGAPIFTCGGTAGGAPCKFPFEWNGVEYDECTRVDEKDDKLWCDTTAEGKWGFCECSDEVSTIKAPLHTCGGTAKRAPCQFPFEYKGVEYHNCTDVDSDKHWCYTGDDGQYGYCECTDAVSTQTPEYTCGATAQGAPCRFPFLYNGNVYEACTRVDDTFGKLWCDTTNGDLWGYCECSDEEYHKSCADIKHADLDAENGVYIIQPRRAGRRYRVYCNMDEYGGGWTLVTLIPNDASELWDPKAINPEDVLNFSHTPSRMAKLFDDDINAILGEGATRWVTAGSTSTFYRMSSSPWYSDHGDASTCDYNIDFYDAMATPAAKPEWRSITSETDFCGGIYDGENWGARSGIHASDSQYLGAFDPAKNEWNQFGFVFVRSTCPEGWFRNVTGICLDIDECEVDNGGCHGERECINLPGSSKCGDCPNGWKNKGDNLCEDINECDNEVPLCASIRKCVNLPGSVECGECPPGYMIDGERACQDIDECLVNNGGCHRKRKCINTAGGSLCVECEKGWTQVGARDCKVDVKPPPSVATKVPSAVDNGVVGAAVGVPLGVVVLLLVVSYVLTRRKYQKRGDEAQTENAEPAPVAISMADMIKEKEGALKKVTTMQRLKQRHTISDFFMDPSPLFLNLITDDEMALLMEGIEKDDPTYFARLGVCPNDHIYARNTLSGLQMEVDDYEHLLTPISELSPVLSPEVESPTSELQSPEVGSPTMESEAKLHSPIIDTTPRRIIAFVDLWRYVSSRDAPQCKEWLRKVEPRDKLELKLLLGQTWLLFSRDQLQREKGTLAELTDPKHTYKLPLPDVAPSQPSIGVILITANPTYENVVPISQRTFKSSNYKRHYQKTPVPQYSHVLLGAVLEIITLYFQRNRVTHCDKQASRFFKKMQDEAFDNADSLANNVDIAAELLWTSALGSTAIQMEICTLINAVIRDDVDEEMPSCCIICRAINARRSIRNEKITLAEQQFPPEGKTYRGGSFDNSVQPFFTCAEGEQKRYRVPGFLATSGSRHVSEGFALKVRSGRPRVMWTIELDPRGRQNVAFRVQNMTFVSHSHVKGEGEYLFAPYSTFYITSTKWSTDPKVPHEISIFAALDNLAESEELPLAPWY